MDGKNIKYRIGKSYGAQIVTTIFAFACVIPLLYILGFILKAGITKINWHFLVNIPKPVGESGGGILNALVGSIMIIFFASLIAIPIGILAGIYLAENGKSRLAYWCRLCVDILQGVPSIVIGIVAYFWLVKPLGGFSALSGSVASFEDDDYPAPFRLHPFLQLAKLDLKLAQLLLVVLSLHFAVVWCSLILCHPLNSRR